jgi:hypothetical protein
LIEVFDMDSRSLTLSEEKEFETGATTSRQGSVHREKTDLDDTPTENEEGSIRNETKAEVAAEAEGDGGEYPKGVRMAFIVVALVLSIFLVCFLSNAMTKAILTHLRCRST